MAFELVIIELGLRNQRIECSISGIIFAFTSLIGICSYKVFFRGETLYEIDDSEEESKSMLNGRVGHLAR